MPQSSCQSRPMRRTRPPCCPWRRRASVHWGRHQTKNEGGAFYVPRRQRTYTSLATLRHEGFVDGRCIARYNNRSPAGEVLQRRALRGGPQRVNNARSQGAGHLYTTLVTQEPEGFRSQGYLIRIRLEKSVKEGLWQIFGKTALRGSKNGRLRKRSTDHKNREISKKFVSF